MRQDAMKLAVVAAASVGIIGGAQAADLPEPVVIQAPVHHVPEVVPSKFTGWYIRGDVGYGWNKFKEAEYITYGPPPGTGILNGELKGAFSIGGGIGYHVNHYLRSDLTLDYMFKSDFHGSTDGFCTAGLAVVACSSVDTTGYEAWTLLANAYIDLGTYSGFTPYVGGGIGGAYVKWHELDNTIPPGFDQSGTTIHEGSSSWRFAYALMAGVSFEATKNVAIDVGYRYKHISGGRMFQFANNTGPGYDKGIHVHEVRAGVRYKFGGGGMQHKPYSPPPVHYDPPMVYK